MEQENKLEKSILKRWWFWVIIIAILTFAGAAIQGITHNNQLAHQKKDFKPKTQRNDLPELVAQNGDNEWHYQWPADVPACPNDLSTLFTHPLYDLTDLSYITPLGNLSPPGHILPVNHIYWILKDAKASAKNSPVYAPGDLHLVNIDDIQLHYTKKEAAQKGMAVRHDHALTFDICKGVYVTLYHIGTISDTIEQAKTTAKEKCENTDFTTMSKGLSESKGFANQENCKYNLNLKIKAGDIIGHSGGTDMGVFDTRQPLAWANPTRFREVHDLGHSKFGMCGLDLYSGQTKNSLYNLLGDKGVINKMRTIEPRCGEIEQDVVGTVQGLWFGTDSPKMNYELDGRVIGFVHQNWDPTLGAITAGAAFYTDPIEDNRALTFHPTHSGTHNREFSEITPGTGIYCYTDQMDKDYGWQKNPFKYLIQLTDATHLKIEKQSGNCSASEAFSNPLIYER